MPENKMRNLALNTQIQDRVHEVRVEREGEQKRKEAEERVKTESKQYFNHQREHHRALKDQI